ncbi:MAG: MFS transporter [Burkholderiales bacterium]
MRIYLPFAFAYFISYALRTINAVVSPELTRELSLGPAALGLLTSAYFLAFCAVQLPNGLLLDRFGPRRTEAALLLFTALGCILFATGDSLASLAVASAFIGLGVSAGLMASLKAISLWFPAERQASVSNWIMVAGSLGALSTTIPVEILIQHVNWRLMFYGMSAAALLASAYLFFTVPDPQKTTRGTSLAEQWRGVAALFRSARFWWIVPIASLPMAGYMAIQSLWAVPWMMEVEGLTRAQAASRLFVMAIAQLLGYFTLSIAVRTLARRGVEPRHLFVGGYALYILGFAGLVIPTPFGFFPSWMMMALGATVNVMGFTIFTEGLPKELFGRAATALNQILFALCFLLQWGIGAVVEGTMALASVPKPSAFVFAFGCVMLAQTVAYAWFLWGWRRHSASSNR